MRKKTFAALAAALLFAAMMPPSAADARPLCQTQIIRVYKAAWCSYCNQLREYLVLNGVHFREIDIDSDVLDPEAKMRLTGVPLTWTERGWIEGYSPAAFRQKLCIP